MASLRLAHPSLLTDPAALAPTLGPVELVAREPFTSGAGFTGSAFERLTFRGPGGATRTFVLKRSRLAEDWTAWMTGDTFGRALLPLDAPALAPVWESFHCPYVAHASGDGEAAMLMEDLAPHLLPDVREPLTAAAEDALLDAIARMHARFWESPALEDPRLLANTGLVEVIGPGIEQAIAGRANPGPLLERVIAGWQVARRHLPAPVTARLLRPAAEIVAGWGPLPRTLVHGDFKVANFAVMPDGRVAAFDWGLVGAAPCAVDVGWSLAINASRIRDDRDRYLARYRVRLEAALGATLPAATWEALVRAAIETGALMLLWSKALALESGTEAARTEWAWWMERLPG